MKVSHINENLEKRIRSYVKVSLIFLMRVNHYRKLELPKRSLQSVLMIWGPAGVIWE